jgi:UPF0716 protein FxsA
MHIGLVLIALAFPLLELAVLIKVGQTIGFWWTVLLLATIAVVGGWIIHTQGLAAAQRWLDDAREGRTTLEPVADSVLLMAAGILLAFPGLLTDVPALLLLIPPLRRSFARWLMSRMLVKGAEQAPQRKWEGDERFGGQHPRQPSRGPAAGKVIDGEWERVEDKPHDSTRPGRETPRT